MSDTDEQVSAPEEEVRVSASAEENPPEVSVNQAFIDENLAVRDQVMAGLLQFELENCGNYGTKFKLELDFLEWSFFIVINEYLKLNVCIMLAEDHISTQLYQDQGDGSYYQDRRSVAKEHTGDLQSQLNSIAATAHSLIWWYYKA